jgi:hypothetical protein
MKNNAKSQRPVKNFNIKANTHADCIDQEHSKMLLVLDKGIYEDAIYRRY